MPESGERKDLGAESQAEAFNALTDRFPAANLTVLAHFYRGELARSVAWRQKMDVTTHWAIVTTAALISMAYTSGGVPHVVLPFGSLLVFLLLNIEGRRYRFFDVWRTRVRMLEIHLLIPALIDKVHLLEGNWREVLCNDLTVPSYKISYWEAVGRRLRRNFVWIFLLLLLAWIVKALLERRPGEGLYEMMRVRAVGGETVLEPWLVWTVMGLFHGFLAFLLIFSAGVREATGEIRRKDPNRKEWPI